MSTIYNRIALTGGGARALDAISVTALADNDVAFVQDQASNNNFGYYVFDSAGTDAESSPDIIRPDDYATAGVWRKSKYYSTFKIGVEYGLVLSVGVDTVHDIDVSAGVVWDSTGLVRMVIPAVTRQIDAALGTGNGGLSSSLTPAANTVYRVFGLSNGDGSTVTVGMDTSDIAANLLADHPTYTKYAFIGFVVTDGSAYIRYFTMSGDMVIFPAGAIQTNTGIGTTYTAMSAGSWLPLSRTKQIFVTTGTADNRHQVRPVAWSSGYYEEMRPNYTNRLVMRVPNNGDDIEVGMDAASPTGTFYLSGCELVR